MIEIALPRSSEGPRPTKAASPKPGAVGSRHLGKSVDACECPPRLPGSPEHSLYATPKTTSPRVRSARRAKRRLRRSVRTRSGRRRATTASAARDSRRLWSTAVRGTADITVPVSSSRRRIRSPMLERPRPIRGKRQSNVPGATATSRPDGVNACETTSANAPGARVPRGNGHAARRVLEDPPFDVHSADSVVHELDPFRGGLRSQRVRQHFVDDDVRLRRKRLPGGREGRLLTGEVRRGAANDDVARSRQPFDDEPRRRKRGNDRVAVDRAERPQQRSRRRAHDGAIVFDLRTTKPSDDLVVGAGSAKRGRRRSEHHRRRDRAQRRPRRGGGTLIPSGTESLTSNRKQVGAEVPAESAP